jgi:hypothetical protein
MNVELNHSLGNLIWNVKGNEIRISWYSEYPVYLAAHAPLFTLTGKTTELFSKGNTIEIRLASTLLNELADEEYNVINDVVLTTLIIKNNLESGQNNEPEFVNYPNPFNHYTMVYYNLPEEGDVTIEVFNVTGISTGILVSGYQTAGEHSLIFDANQLSAGIYTAVLRYGNPQNIQQKTIRLVIN